jgi:N4-gp56 family major capsid protein
MVNIHAGEHVNIPLPLGALAMSKNSFSTSRKKPLVIPNYWSYIVAKTNFATLLSEQKMVWSRSVWKAARENSFIMKFASTSDNSPIQRITELTRDERGDRAVITLVTDLDTDGVAGDNDLEGNEGTLEAHDQVIKIDQLRHAVRNTGRMNDQKTIVNFRQQAKSALAHWLADRMDQMAFLCMSGINFNRNTNGSPRPVTSGLPALAYAADVSAPTANRHLRVSGNSVVLGLPAALTAADKIKYDHIIDMHTFAKVNFIKPVRGDGGEEIYHLIMHPLVLATLKKDPEFRENIRHAWTRGGSNPLFKGGESFLLDGVMVHSYRHCFNTKGATAPNKFGAAGAIDGSRMLFLGAQALGIADLGPGYWDEKNDFDYNNQKGIAYGKIAGMLKPKFKSPVTGTTEDFGMFVVDVAI